MTAELSAEERETDVAMAKGNAWLLTLAALTELRAFKAEVRDKLRAQTVIFKPGERVGFSQELYTEAPNQAETVEFGSLEKREARFDQVCSEEGAKLDPEACRQAGESLRAWAGKELPVGADEDLYTPARQVALAHQDDDSRPWDDEAARRYGEIPAHLCDSPAVEPHEAGTLYVNMYSHYGDSVDPVVAYSTASAAEEFACPSTGGRRAKIAVPYVPKARLDEAMAKLSEAEGMFDVVDEACKNFVREARENRERAEKAEAERDALKARADKFEKDWETAWEAFTKSQDNLEELGHERNALQKQLAADEVLGELDYGEVEAARQWIKRPVWTSEAAWPEVLGQYARHVTTSLRISLATARALNDSFRTAEKALRAELAAAKEELARRPRVKAAPTGYVVRSNAGRNFNFFDHKTEAEATARSWARSPLGDDNTFCAVPMYELETT